MNKLEQFKSYTKDLLQIVNSLQNGIDQNGMNRGYSQKISILNHIVTNLEAFLTKYENGQNTDGLEYIMFHD